MREEINCSELTFSRIVEIIVSSQAVHTLAWKPIQFAEWSCAADVQNMVAMGTV